VGFISDPQSFGDDLGFIGDAAHDFGFIADPPAVSDSPEPLPGGRLPGNSPGDNSAMTPMSRSFGELANPYARQFTSGAQILRQFQNEPAPDVSGAVASALFPEPEPDQSLMGLNTEKSPGSREISQTLGVPPSVAMPLSAFAKTVTGIGGYLTSPRGMTESGIAAVPGIGLVQRAKWLYDLASSTGQMVGNLSVTLPRAWKDPDSLSPQDWQQLNDDTVNLAASLAVAGKLGKDGMEQVTGVPSPRIGLKTSPTPATAATIIGPNRFGWRIPANVPATSDGVGTGQISFGPGNLLRDGAPVSQSDVDAWLGFVHDTVPSSTDPSGGAGEPGNSTPESNLPQLSPLSSPGQPALTPGTGNVKMLGSVGSNSGGQITTVLGRMQHLDPFKNDPNIDTWAKSGRIPEADDLPVTWAENQDWLDKRIARGDKFALATDPATLPPVVDGHVPGQANGYFTARELRYLKQKGVSVTAMYQ
jgi:hypothetical protein